MSHTIHDTSRSYIHRFNSQGSLSPTSFVAPTTRIRYSVGESRPFPFLYLTEDLGGFPHVGTVVEPKSGHFDERLKTGALDTTKFGDLTTV